VASAAEGVKALEALGRESRNRLIVEDATRPLAPSAEVTGTARIVTDLPEHVEVETESAGPAYLVLADTFDPGWTATVDGTPASIHPAYVAFRAVALPSGNHAVVFRYRPAGFLAGLGVSTLGIVAALLVWFLPSPGPQTAADHRALADWRRHRKILLWSFVAIVVVSTIKIGPGPRLYIQSRWQDGFHRFTWGAGVEAMKHNRQ
jgi:hypothetical protein